MALCRRRQVHRQGRSLVGLGRVEVDIKIVRALVCALGWRGPMNGAVIAASRIGLIARRIGIAAGGCRCHGLV